MALGQLWLTQMATSGSYFETILPGMIVNAFGMGLALPTASIALTDGIPPEEQGVVGAVFVTSQQVGAAVGLALLATIAAGVTQANGASVAAGYGVAVAVSTCLAVVAIAIVLLRCRSRADIPHRSTP